MPIEIIHNTKSRREALITCTVKDCPESIQVEFSSPAAPDLTACEEAEKSGWGYEVGFFSMLTGEHYPICPECKKTPGTLEKKEGVL
jgi:hypothetical protein